MSQPNLTVQAYLFFRGRCEEALEFYRRALGAEVLSTTRFSDAPDSFEQQPGSENKIMHSAFRIGQTTLMASDGRDEGAPNFDGFSLSITAADETQAERLFNALAAGGKIEMPLSETFWTSKFGMLEDKFGVSWMVSVEHKQQ